MPAADQTFSRLAGHFTRPVLATLIAERRPEIASALLAGLEAPPITGEDLLRALREGRVRANRVRFYINRRKIELEKLGVADNDPVPAELIDQMIRQGATLVFNHVDRAFEQPHRLAGLVGTELKQRIEISAVLSLTDRSGLAPHHDLVNVFIVQLEGEKEWSLLGSPVREGLPMDGFVGEEGAASMTTLRAGDVMFLPAGQRHRCSPSPSGSLHLGILLHAPSGAQAAAVLSDAITGDADMRRPYLAFAQETELPARVASYRARLHELVDELDLLSVLDDSRRREQPVPEIPFEQAGEITVKTDPRVDEKIAKAADFARPILEHWRALVHATVPEVEEAIKWGMPHFVYKGKNIAGMAPFKAHCAIMIHGDGRQETEGMGSYGKLAKLEDLPSDAELIAKLQNAVARIDRGEKEPWRQQSPKPKARIEVPQDLAAGLAAKPAAAQFWDKLAPSHRYEYLQWITEAKRDETRVKRLAQALEWLGEGKRRNWKYESC